MSSSVREYLTDINEYTFLPGIQREFVWNPSQIARLFDSLIRNYPVGAITEWNVRNSTMDNFQSYQLIANYVASKGTLPDEVIEAGFTRYNNQVSSEATVESLIIDGQQRLNSLYIGVCGEVARYNGGRGYSQADVNNWEAKALCIDLFGHIDFTDGDVRGDYEFQFRRVEGFGKHAETGYRYNDNIHRIWMPVSDFWEDGLIGQGKVRNVVDSYLENASVAVDQSTQSHLRDIAQAVGLDLYNKVLTKDVITDSVDHETTEIPEIFQRLNLEGENPRPYQLLMSQLMSYWPYADDEEIQINPRDQVEKWIDQFCDDFTPYERQINRDLFMRYSSYLVKRDLLESGIGSLSEEDMDTIRQKWLYSPSATQGRFEWFRSSLAHAFKSVINAGVRPSIMNNMPTFAVLGVFYYYNPDAKVGRENRNAIFKFLAQCLLLNESYATFSIGNTRSWMRYLNDHEGEYTVFPRQELLSHENLNPSVEDIQLIVESARYTGEPGQPVFTDQNVTAILGLLDETYTSHATRDIGDYDVDHIFPRSKTAEIETAVGHRVDLDRIGNLQLLHHPLNQEEKREMWPKEWFESSEVSDEEAAEIRRVNQYPKSSLDPASAEHFIVAREEKLIEHLTNEYVE